MKGGARDPGTIHRVIENSRDESRPEIDVT